MTQIRAFAVYLLEFLHFVRIFLLATKFLAVFTVAVRDVCLYSVCYMFLVTYLDQTKEYFCYASFIFSFVALKMKSLKRHGKCVVFLATWLVLDERRKGRR